MSFTSAVRVPTIPTSSQNFKLEIGFGNSFSSGDSTNFIGFAFNRLISTTNLCIVTGNEGAYTIQIGPSLTANAWFTFRAVINSTGTSVEFFINESSIGTIATNIPTNAIAPLIKITQVNGSSERQIDCDYFALEKVFTTPR